ncbi:MAG: hypothetical protein M0R50_08700 [Candidatus Cloacimonetes bacterium]|jgi:hypothetical protein|nr:hypothetical protein [Candidatus Cloacimonadota bacterium]
MNIYDLAEQYLINTEEFDKTVCTARKDGIAIPTTSYQYVTINKYAIRWLQCVLDMGYTIEEWQEAIHDPATRKAAKIAQKVPQESNAIH